MHERLQLPDSNGERVRIALGIPTFNRSHVLLQTLDQVLAQAPPADEIIVVDQSDWYPDGARERLETLAALGKILYVRQDTPNLPMARNRVLAETTCAIVIFIDDDVNLTPGFVAGHLANYTETDVWAVCGRVTEGLVARPKQVRTWPKAVDYRFSDVAWDDRIENFGSFKGCNHSVRRDKAQDVGEYDTGYQGVALREESDLALRILAAGGRIVFDPNASLHHLRAPAGGCRVNQWGDWTAGLCSLRFAIKHRRVLGRYFWWEFWHAYRLGVANRNTVKFPWIVLVRSVRFLLKALTIQADRST